MAQAVAYREIPVRRAVIDGDAALAGREIGCRPAADNPLVDQRAAAEVRTVAAAAASARRDDALAAGDRALECDRVEIDSGQWIVGAGAGRYGISQCRWIGTRCTR
jgi:hypothetical protein